MPLDDRGRPMRLIDDFAALLLFIDAGRERHPHYRAALDLVPDLRPDEVDRMIVTLDCVVVNFVTFRGARTSVTTVRSAIERALAAWAAMGDALEDLAVARQAQIGRGDLGLSLHALYAGVSEALLPGAPMPSWEPDQPGQIPHRGFLQGGARQIRDLVAALGIADLELPRRTVDPAFDRFIGDLASYWRGWTYSEPTTATKSGTTHRSPFVRFVHHVWGAVGRDPPSSRTIDRGLERYATLTAEQGA